MKDTLNNEKKDLNGGSNQLIEIIIRKYDNDDKSRIHLDNKLALLITEVGIVMGFLISQNSLTLNHIPAFIAFFVALLSYLFGIFPRDINDFPSTKFVVWLRDYCGNDKQLNSKLIESFTAERIQESFIENKKMLDIKYWSLVCGLISNIVGFVLWVLALLS